MNERILGKTDELTPLVGRIAEIIEQARGQVRQSVNQAVVTSYREIGRLIVEHEQQGKARAAYGKQQLVELSARLCVSFFRLTRFATQCVVNWAGRTIAAFCEWRTPPPAIGT